MTAHLLRSLFTQMTSKTFRLKARRHSQASQPLSRLKLLLLLLLRLLLRLLLLLKLLQRLRALDRRLEAAIDEHCGYVSSRLPSGAEPQLRGSGRRDAHPGKMIQNEFIKT
jgi:hypothetical protein